MLLKLFLLLFNYSFIIVIIIIIAWKCKLSSLPLCRHCFWQRWQFQWLLPMKKKNPCHLWVCDSFTQLKPLFLNSHFKTNIALDETACVGPSYYIKPGLFDCTIERQVYKFNKVTKKCEEITIYCGSGHNMFQNESTCLEICQRLIQNPDMVGKYRKIYLQSFPSYLWRDIMEQVVLFTRRSQFLLASFL